MTKPYPKYKNAGTEWVVEIPEHWDMKKLKFVARINPSGKHSKDLKGNPLVPFLPMENLSESGAFDFGLLKPLVELQSGFTYFERGDVIVAKITPCFENGKAGLIGGLNGGFGFGSTEFHVMRANQAYLDNKFLFFIIRSHLFRSMGEALMEGSAGQKRVPTWFVSEYGLALPPLPEQHAIASYLDDKTRKIDALIEKKQRLIELLKEQRTAIINQAVTKGIDPNVKMKDSGIEWIGKIPVHWKVKKLKHLASVKGRIGFRGYTVDDLVDEGNGALTIGGKHINSKYELNFSDPEYISWDKYFESPEIMVSEGDLVFAQRGTLGRVALVDRDLGKATINPSLVLIKGLRIKPKFLLYYIISDYIQNTVDLMTSSTAVPMLSQEQIENFTILEPTNSEQVEISDFLCQQTGVIDSGIAKAEKHIALLQEYRTALISEVVTGKIDVRDYVSEWNK